MINDLLTGSCFVRHRVLFMFLGPAAFSRCHIKMIQTPLFRRPGPIVQRSFVYLMFTLTLFANTGVKHAAALFSLFSPFLFHTKLQSCKSRPFQASAINAHYFTPTDRPAGRTRRPPAPQHKEVLTVPGVNTYLPLYLQNSTRI